MHRNQEGFTLPEILIGLAISSIIIAASFASYIVIKQNYDFQKDMKNISQSSRAVATMIMRDIRMAGYNYDDGPTKMKPEITTPIKISDGGTTAPDSIEIIYDKSYTQRLKISYYTKAYNNRLRLYKKVEKCNAMNCESGSLQTIISESTIADYVEDLQFIGTRLGNLASNGARGCNMGNNRPIRPTKVTSTCPNSKNESAAFDGNDDTFWSADISGECYLRFSFPNEIEILTLTAKTPAHLDGGSIDLSKVSANDRSFLSSAVHPYGTSHSVRIGTRLRPRNQMYCVGCATDYDRNGNLYNVDGKCHGGSYPWADKPFQYLGNNAVCDMQNEQNGPKKSQQGNSNQWCTKQGDDGSFNLHATKNFELRLGSQHDNAGNTGSQICTYSGKGATGCRLQDSNKISIAEIEIQATVYGEPQIPWEVELGILLRSPSEHGTSPIAQTFNIGNYVLNTNDNYIRDSYSISAVVRNIFYDR